MQTEQHASVEVPRNLGVAGLVRAVEAALRLPLVQEVRIGRNRVVDARYFAENDKALPPLAPDFAGLHPEEVLQRCTIVEMHVPEGARASDALCALLDDVSSRAQHPVAFVSGLAPEVLGWYTRTVGAALRTVEQLMGLPLLTTREVPDTSLVLLASIGAGASVAEATYAYKIEVPTERALHVR